jgi:hypothetical protein
MKNEALRAKAGLSSDRWEGDECFPTEYAHPRAAFLLQRIAASERG